jgi:hypothetical protein
MSSCAKERPQTRANPSAARWSVARRPKHSTTAPSASTSCAFAETKHPCVKRGGHIRHERPTARRPHRLLHARIGLLPLRPFCRHAQHDPRLRRDSALASSPFVVRAPSKRPLWDWRRASHRRLSGCTSPLNISGQALGWHPSGARRYALNPKTEVTRTSQDDRLSRLPKRRGLHAPHLGHGDGGAPGIRGARCLGPPPRRRPELRTQLLSMMKAEVATRSCVLTAQT